MTRQGECNAWLMLLLVPTVLSLTDWQILINTARCRTICIKKFLPPSKKISNTRCQNIPDCKKCWEMCDEMYTLPYIFTDCPEPSKCCHSACVTFGITTYGPCHSMNKCVCGCQTACLFRYEENQKPLRNKRIAKFPNRARISESGTMLSVTWKRPTVKNDRTRKKDILVYSLLARETGSKIWHPVLQTVSRSATVKAGSLPYLVEFKIIAVNRTGLISQTVIRNTKNLLTTEFQLTQTDRSLSSNVAFDVAVRVVQRNGTLKAVIRWLNKDAMYYLSYGLDDCNVDINMPRCNLTVHDEIKEKAITASPNKEETAVVTGLLYNSVYWVNVNSLSLEVEYKKAMFITPSCKLPDETFTRCSSKQASMAEATGKKQILGTKPTAPQPWTDEKVTDTTIEIKVSNKTVRAIVGWRNMAQEYVVIYAANTEKYEDEKCSFGSVNVKVKGNKKKKIYFDTDTLLFGTSYWLQVKGVTPPVDYTSIEFRTPPCDAPNQGCIFTCPMNDMYNGLSRTASADDPHRINISTEKSHGVATVRLDWNGTYSKYDVHYGIDEIGRHCQHAMGDFHVRTVIGNGAKLNTMHIPDLVFGAKYWIEIDGKRPGSSYKYKRTTFRTPFCAKPDSACTRCIEERNIGRPSGHSVAAPDKPWEPTLSMIEWSSEKGKVLVTITWPNVSEETALYRVKWNAMELQDPNVHSSAGTAKTNQTFIRLTFLPNLYYGVEVDAMTYENDVLETTSTSDILTVNTTMRLSQLPIRNAAAKSDVNTIIIVVVSVAAFSIGLMIFIVIFRKYRGEIAIVKTVTANSNSYKSSLNDGIQDTPVNLFNRQINRPELLIAVKDEWEIDHGNLILGNVLGQGAFGKVIVGQLNGETVAVKVLKDNVALSYKEDFLDEIALMKKLGPHQHIVSMVGACTLSDPVTLVLEFLPHGNLQNFLKKCRMHGTLSMSVEGVQELEYEEAGNNWVVTATDMLSFARQIAMAMEYIAERKFVHRDLAARNILVGPNKFVKLCDFGLSRDVYGSNLYHKVTNGKLPLKWMALESLRDRVFTTYSDIWSYGVLLYEIATLGGSPYPTIALADLYTMLVRGYRMDRPSNCSNELYSIMTECWNETAMRRPNFTEIRERLEDLMSLDKDYLRLDNIDVPINPCDNTSDAVNDTPEEDSDGEGILSESTPLTASSPCPEVEPYLESIPSTNNSPAVIVIESTSV